MTMMKRQRAILVSVVCLLVALPVAGDEAAARRSAAALAEHLFAATGVPGMAVSVGTSSAVTFSAVYGKADLENEAPVTASTRFRAASVSKVLTAAALARLAARGVVDLDTPVRNWFPEVPETTPPITLRRLAGHLGGIRHYLGKDFERGIDYRHRESLTDALPLFIDDELVAAPGERYHYSTFGYTLIGAVIEKATGKPFLEVMHEEVFGPLGMTTSGGDVQSEIIEGRTRFYERGSEGRLVNADPVDPSYKWPGGGLLTSATDLVRFGGAHLGDDFLPASITRELFTSQHTTAGEETGVGIGWRVGHDFAGRRIVHHSGAMGGARSSILVYPDDDLVLAIMTNLGATPAYVEDSLQVIAQSFLSGTDASPRPAPGEWTYEGTFGDASVSGTLTLEPGPGARGSMSVAPAIRERFESRGLPVDESLSIPAFLSTPRGDFMVLATSLGLLPVPVEVETSSIRGSISVARTSLVIQARPTGSPPE